MLEMDSLMSISLSLLFMPMARSGSILKLCLSFLTFLLPRSTAFLSSLPLKKS